MFAFYVKCRFLRRTAAAREDIWQLRILRSSGSGKHKAALDARGAEQNRAEQSKTVASGAKYSKTGQNTIAQVDE